jgi:hypothetical protein
MQPDLAHISEPEPEAAQTAEKLLQAADYKTLNRLKLVLGHILLPSRSFVLVPNWQPLIRVCILWVLMKLQVISNVQQ